MRIRIKTKLSFGLGFLFAVIIVIGGMGAYYLYRLSDDTKKILIDNYESLEYSKNMMQALDKIQKDQSPTSFLTFEKNLTAQQKNVTEVGEKEKTDALTGYYNEYKKSSSGNSLLLLDIREQLYHITEINMNAIVAKSKKAEATSHEILTYMGWIGGICFLVVFTFIVNFPGYIANPITQLTIGIKQIADKNYTQRLHFSSNDEFGELAEAFNSMSKKLDEYEHSNLAQIMFEKQRIETIINNMHDAVIGFDENKKILFVNDEALKLLGVSSKDITGRYAPDVALRNDLLRNLVSNKKPEAKMKIYADCKESYFSKEIYEVKSKEENKIIGEVIILKNITPFQELDIAKTNFIATVSHELKTPISSIKMSLKLLEDERIGKLNEEQKDLLKNISEDSQRLLNITGELLNMTQVETGNIQLNIHSTEPSKIIEYAVEAIRFQAEQKNIKIEVLCLNTLPPVNADIDKTAWVLVNLLSNALRYSPEGSKIIVAALYKGKQVKFSVKDFGTGIDEKYRGKIFNRYFQVPGSKKAGTGLGLAISKEFIEAQGGEIFVESEIGEGSTFSFLLNEC